MPLNMKLKNNFSGLTPKEAAHISTNYNYVANITQLHLTAYIVA